MKVSYSQLKLFEACPYLYKYEYIDNEPVPSSHEAEMGTLMHEVMHYLYSSGDNFPSIDEVLDYYKKKWNEKDMEKFFDDENQAQIHFKQGKRILKENYEQDENIQNEQNPALKLESYFSLPLEDEEKGRTHKITGRIDRIDKKGDELEIIDYKTSKTLDTQNQVENNLQLGIYHLALIENFWPEFEDRNIKVSLHFLKHQERLTVEKSKKELEETKERVLDLIRDLEEAKEKGKFKAKKSGLCGWGPYRHICPYFKDQYEDEKKKIEEDITKEEAVDEYTEIKNKIKTLKKKKKDMEALIDDYLEENEIKALYSSDSKVQKEERERVSYQLDSILKELEDEEAKKALIEEIDVSKKDLKKLDEVLSKEDRKELQEKVDKNKTSYSFLRPKKVEE